MIKQRHSGKERNKNDRATYARWRDSRHRKEVEITRYGQNGEREQSVPILAIRFLWDVPRIGVQEHRDRHRKDCEKESKLLPVQSHTRRVCHSRTPLPYKKGEAPEVDPKT